MAEQQKPNSAMEHPPKPTNTVPPPPPTSASWTSGGEAAPRSSHHYPNPPDSVNPDVATLRDQWRFAIRQYSRWYSHAWGTAILAGVSFFALGWFIKGSNPLPSRANPDHTDDQPPSAAPATDRNKGAREKSLGFSVV
ncbi:uncharacterized protein LOC103708312 isoform X1 [Phoenix dactylifera]|uniref:Uncharacterized protein LOC103708312 isoform X1 n=2 Tax=Phoenix dactylifera TaxID=42345 RepID=A0A8B9AIS7_PHODC|nr:uncharacterized protein LOC103708312 isoform X1 [Phoenix dactylifera]